MMTSAAGILVLVLGLVHNVHHITGLPRFASDIILELGRQQNLNQLDYSSDIKKSDADVTLKSINSYKNPYIPEKSEYLSGTTESDSETSTNSIVDPAEEIPEDTAEKLNSEIKSSEEEEHAAQTRYWYQERIDPEFVRLPPFTPDVWDAFGDAPRAPLSILEQYKHNFGI